MELPWVTDLRSRIAARRSVLPKYNFIVPTPMLPLKPSDGLQISIRGVSVPTAIQAGTDGRLVLFVSNQSTLSLASTPPNPVNLAAEWVQDGLPAIGEPERLALPRRIEPGEGLEFGVLLNAPNQPGDYKLVLTLVQEGVAWLRDWCVSLDTEFPVRVH